MTMSLLYMNNRYILTYIKTMTIFLKLLFKTFTKKYNKGKHIKNSGEVAEEKPTECSNENIIYQNIPKETHLQKEKIWTIPLILGSPKSKQLQTPDLEIDFLIDSGAESNIIYIPT